jgi:hypothetical protein
MMAISLELIELNKLVSARSDLFLIPDSTVSQLCSAAIQLAATSHDSPMAMLWAPVTEPKQNLMYLLRYHSDSTPRGDIIAKAVKTVKKGAAQDFTADDSSTSLQANIYPSGAIYQKLDPNECWN